MITPEQIDTREFKVKFRGYDADEVDGFLDEVTVDYRHLLREFGVLRERVATLERQLDHANSQPLPVIPEEFAGAVKLLNVAQQTHDATVTEANDTAGRIVADAEKRAKDIVESGHEKRHQVIGQLDERRAGLEEHVAALQKTMQVVTDRMSRALENIGGAT